MTRRASRVTLAAWARSPEKAPRTSSRWVPSRDRSEDVNGYTISFASFAQDIHGAPLLKGLPGEHCSCPHWGYVFKGTATFDFGDRQETYVAGDAFYVPPGHTPAHSADSELLLFSPADALKVTAEAMRAAMQDA